MKRSLLALFVLPVIGCGGVGAPSPSNYCGEMPDSGFYDLYGPVVLVVQADERVIGTLQNGTRRFEIRGDLSPNGSFRGVLDGAIDFDVSGTIQSSRSQDVAAAWTITGPGDQIDNVTFRLGDCSG